MRNQIQSFSLRSAVSYYRKKAKIISLALNDKPEEWGKFQNDFNNEVNYLFSQIINFEKKCLKSNHFDSLRRVKDFFIKNFRKYFYYGKLSTWSIDKPYGYAGDFKIIDDIYLNNPQTTGYERLFDNYFLTSAISVAVRNRKEDFKREIVSCIRNHSGNEKLMVMNLASGPAREIKELLDENPDLKQKVHFDCYDIEEDAHNHAKMLLGNEKNVTFIVENALRLSVMRDINKRINKKYDLIYSMGLFDYLNYKISAKLVKNLRSLLNKDGALLIADVRDRYLNPSVLYMEWSGGWDLIYRKDEEFENIFVSAGFEKAKIRRQYEQQGVLQYIKATK